MDVILVIDESGSMSNDMPAMKVFATNIVASFQPLGEANHAMFAVVGFADDAALYTSFSAIQSWINSKIYEMCAALPPGLRVRHH